MKYLPIPQRRNLYYKPNPQYKERQFYTSDYFSGCDVRILFNNVYVEEITSIQFSIEENILPLFGIFDYVATHVARGNRIITGEFTINFVTNNYLFHILNYINKNLGLYRLGPGSEKTFEDIIRELIEEKKKIIQVSQEEASKLQSSTAKKHFTAEELLDEDIVDKLHDIEQARELYNRVQGQTQDTEVSLFTPLTDIESHSVKSYFERGTDLEFDIIIDYGNSIERMGGTAGKIDTGIKTIKVINGVVLRGCVQTIGISGEPIQETYSFIARDMDTILE